LDGQWRKVIIGGPPEMALLQRQVFGTMAGGTQGVYYTKGQIPTIGNDIYLIAYRAQPRLDRETMRRGIGPQFDEQGNPLGQKLAADATLSLLNLRRIDSINDIRPFDPQQDVEKELDKAARINQASVRNLRQIGVGLMMYAQDYDEKLPLMTSARSRREMQQPLPPRRSGTVQQVLMPYVRTPETFVHPATRQIYRPNPSLSRKSLGEIEDAATTVAFYEPAVASDGKRAVLFLDGHVERVPETDWPRLKKESKIPP
jgi:prepilin-type processing-associated H-X9-DG protein